MNLKGFGRKRYLPNRVTIPKLVSMGWEWLRQISVRARPITCRNSKQVSPKCKFKGMNGLGKSTEDHKQNSWWIDGRGTSRIEIWMGRNCRIKQKPLGKNLFFVCVCVCVYLNLQCRIRCTVRILNSLHAAGLGAPNFREAVEGYYTLKIPFIPDCRWNINTSVFGRLPYSTDRQNSSSDVTIIEMKSE